MKINSGRMVQDPTLRKYMLAALILIAVKACNRYATVQVSILPHALEFELKVSAFRELQESLRGLAADFYIPDFDPTDRSGHALDNKAPVEHQFTYRLKLSN